MTAGIRAHATTIEVIEPALSDNARAYQMDQGGVYRRRQPPDRQCDLRRSAGGNSVVTETASPPRRPRSARSSRYSRSAYTGRCSRLTH